MSHKQEDAIQSSRLIYKNITKQKPHYLLFKNFGSGDENIGNRYVKLNQKLRCSLSIKLKAQK